MISGTSQPAQGRGLEDDAMGSSYLQLSLASTSEEQHWSRCQFSYIFTLLWKERFLVSLLNFYHICLFIRYCYIVCLVAKIIMATVIYLQSKLK